MTMNGSTSGYTFPGFLSSFTSLVNTNVVCRGYGNNVLNADGTQSGAGVLRQGTSQVTSLSSTYVYLGYVQGTSTPQITLRGDSGTSCTSGGKIIGVDSRGTGTSGQLVRADRFSAWANQLILSP
jgi:hypothetical protein